MDAPAIRPDGSGISMLIVVKSLNLTNIMPVHFQVTLRRMLSEVRKRKRRLGNTLGMRRTPNALLPEMCRDDVRRSEN